jgi:hypothetical protein
MTAKSKTFITLGPVIDVEARFTRRDPVLFLGLAVGLAFQDTLRESRKVQPLEEKSILDDVPP